MRLPRMNTGLYLMGLANSSSEEFNFEELYKFGKQVHKLLNDISYEPNEPKKPKANERQTFSHQEP